MKVKIEDLKENSENPRILSQKKFEMLKKSIKEFPKMMELRPIVVNKDMIILGGNMRYRALKELGYEEVEVEVLDDYQKEYEFIVKDNLAYGEWTWAELVEDYTSKDLNDWGLDLPVWYNDLEKTLNETEKTEAKLSEVLKEKQVTSKKTLYLFFSKEDREFIVEKLNEIRKKDNKTMEQVFLDIIKMNV